MSTKTKRPRAVTMVILVAILLGLWNAGQLVALIQQVSLLLPLDIRPDPRLRIALAAGFMLLFWGVAIALKLKKSYTRLMVPLFIALYALYELVLLGFFVRVPVGDGRLILQTGFSAALVLFAIWALNNDSARNYFQVEEELAATA